MLGITRNLLIAMSAGCLLVACSPQTGGGSNAQAEQADAGYLEIVRFGEDNGSVYIGNPDAEVELVEYASLTCSHCADFHNQVMPRIKRDYIATGKVRFVFQEFPTPPVPVALAGFALARCSGESGYLGTLDDFFASQATIFETARSGDVRPQLVELGERNGTKADEFDDCVNNQNHRRAVASSVTYGQSLGVISTPTLFLNGQKLETRESRTPEGLAEMMDSVLAGKPAVPPAVSTIPETSTPETGSGS